MPLYMDIHCLPEGVTADMVPAHIAAAVHRAIAKEPADRFESAGAFAAALGARPSTETV